MSRSDTQSALQQGRSESEREKTGRSLLKESKKRKIQADLRHTSEAELLELGDQQEYFGVIKKKG